MDDTYAEIDAYAQILDKQQQSRKNRQLRDHFDSRLPIEYRYPKRNSITFAVSSKQRSLASKSSSSGYSSSGSISSITTIVNGPKPYRPKEEDVLNLKHTVNLENNKAPVEVEAKSKACCIECREKELRDELDLETHQYANLQSLEKPQDPYVFLMRTMLSNLQREEGGRKVAKVQQKLEKVLRMKPREPFQVDNRILFERQISAFESDVTIRLQAVCEVAPDTYREISAKFCEALHHGNPNTKGLKGIVKGVKNLLNF